MFLVLEEKFGNDSLITFCIFTLIIFSIWIFFYDHSQFTGLQGKGEGISLTSHYHFHPLHSHLDISRAISRELTSALS